MTDAPVQLDLSPGERLTPIYMIGDSHTLAFADLLFRDAVSGKAFVTRAKYCRGCSASRFRDEKGTLHPGVLAALVSENLLDENGQPMHRSETKSTESIEAALERAGSDPAIVFFAGDIDLRSVFLKQLGASNDFELPFLAPGLEAFPPVPNRQVVPTNLVIEFATKLIHPFLSGVVALQQAGFANVFVHSLAPPTLDDAQFREINGYDCPALVRYKATMLFNRLMQNVCNGTKLPFLDLWKDVTIENRLDPRWQLDGVHLNRDATRLTVRHVVETLADRPRVASKRRYEKALGLARAGAAPPDEALRRRFETEGIVVTRIDPAVVSRIRDGLAFDLDVGNRHRRLDWSGNPVQAFSPHLRTATPGPAVLRELHSLVFGDPIARLIRSCTGYSFTLFNARPVRSTPHQEQGSGPQGFHRDGCPPGVIRALLYLTDVDEGSGPFEFVVGEGESRIVTGPAGTFFVFEANQLLHRARPPLARERMVVDFVIAPLVPGRTPEVLFAGMNNWPVDPFEFSRGGLLSFPV